MHSRASTYHKGFPAPTRVLCAGDVDCRLPGEDRYWLLPNRPAVTAPFGGAWYSNISSTEVDAYLLQGDMKYVDEAIALSLEVIESSSWKVVNDVTGAMPDVPAMLAGYPLAMRRRQRSTSDMSPLTVVIDLTTSQGVGQTVIRQRATAILALVRILTAQRPVTCYVGVALSTNIGRSASISLYWPLETLPLSLAHAGAILGSSAVARGLGYNWLCAAGFDGGWPFRNCAFHCSTAKTRLETIFGTSILYIPPLHVTEKFNASWLERRLKELNPQQE